MALLKTLREFLSLPGTSLFDKAYSLQFEFDELRRPQPVSEAGLQIVPNISYQDRPDSDPGLQTLDLYAALLGNDGATARAVVMFLHGGGWRASDKSDPLGVHANVCKALAHRGIVAVNVNYRLAPHSKHPAAAHDAAAAFHWVRQNIAEFGGNPKQIFLCGHSAGGQLAALVTLDPSYLSAVSETTADVCGVIGVSGIYNVAHFAGRNWMAEYLMTRPAFSSEESRKSGSPVNHVAAGAPPFLMLNAEVDERLEEEAEELAPLLRAQGGRAETKILSGTNHFTILSRVGNGDDRLIDEITKFVT